MLDPCLGVSDESPCVEFLRWVLPRIGMRWEGFRRVRSQVCKRLHRRMDALGIADLPGYRAFLEGHSEEWAVLDEQCRITISRFCRDRGTFARIGDVLADVARVGEPAKPVRAWSAGCASGEEPYSVSLLWHFEVADRADRSIEITATDVDTQVLRRAERACYPVGALREIPQRWRDEAFVLQDAEFCLRPSFRQVVTFRQEDLRKTMPEGPFDLILCRNLAFTYFDPPGQDAIARRLAERMPPGGHLVLGAHEALPPGPWFVPTAHRSLYQRSSDA